MDAGRPLVEGAAHGEGASVEDVGVDHCGGDVAVAQELLDGADVVARFEQVRSEAVAKGVARCGLRNLGGLACRVKGTLEHGFVQVVPPVPAPRIAILARCREDPLPGPLSFRKRVFVDERTR